MADGGPSVPHPGLAWAAETEAGRAWLARLPTLLEDAADAWGLRVGEPFPYAFAALALPARTRDGEDAVLKLAFPDRESEHEGAALAAWGGEGSVRLLAEDGELGALLLERCRPGEPLAAAGAELALEVAVGLLPRLWIPAEAPFRTLAEEARWWAEGLERRWEDAGRSMASRVVEAALDALERLPATQSEAVLLHQDLHAGNVLSAEREPWLVIDPKPLLGERELGIAALVRGAELGHSREDVVGRLDRLTADLGLDRERARLWALAQTVAWSLGEGASKGHAEVAEWLLEA